MPSTKNSKNATRDWIESAPLSESVRALARRGELRRFAKGAVVIQEGDVGDTLYVILDGQLRVFTSTMASDRQFTFNTYGPGEYVGEMGLDGGERSASVEATLQTVCSVVTRRTLEQHIREVPDFAFELIAKVIRRARSATLSAKSMALNDVYGRLKEFLENHAELQPDGNTRRVLERHTHQQIAHLLGCSREMVTRQIKDLQKGKYLSPERGELVILKPLPPRW